MSDDWKCEEINYRAAPKCHVPAPFRSVLQRWWHLWAYGKLKQQAWRSFFSQLAVSIDYKNEYWEIQKTNEFHSCWIVTKQKQRSEKKPHHHLNLMIVCSWNTQTTHAKTTFRHDSDLPRVNCLLVTGLVAASTMVKKKLRDFIR